MSEQEKEQPQIIYVPAFADQSAARSDEIDLLEIWRILWAGKKIIIGFTLICTLLAILISFFVLPVTYKSEAVLIPASAQENAMSGLAGLASNLPFPLAFPIDAKTNSILAFLQSRNLKERLLGKYDLLPRLYSDQWDHSKKSWRTKDPADQPTVVLAIQQEALEDIYLVSQNKESSLITISWVDQDPAFCASMLQSILHELEYYLDNEYETDAERERGFIEGQLALATRDLEYWEQQVPSQEVTLAKIQRERLAAQTVYTELRKQLELARIAEAKELIRFKVLDAPMVPEVMFKPRRILISMLILLLSGCLSIFFVLGRHFIEQLKARPTS